MHWIKVQASSSKSMSLQDRQMIKIIVRPAKSIKAMWYKPIN